LRDPGTPAYYDVQNKMPDFGNRLPPRTSATWSLFFNHSSKTTQRLPKEADT